MSKEKLLKATHQGVLNLNDQELACAVLDDGTRVISRNAIFRAFGRSKRGRKKDEIRVPGKPELPSFIDAKNLQPFMDSDLQEALQRIDYLDNNKEVSSGYNAIIIPLICNVYLEARKLNKLTKQQQHLAIASEILVRSLAKVGIVALVDEATGYQYVRERDELQKILKAYISEELLPWQKRFPDEFYREIFRLNGWDYTVNGIKKRPGIIGTWTKQLIYSKLPKGILKELIKKTPKSEKGNYKARFHQSLTSDVGHPHLEKQLVSVITLMNISDDWREFLKHFNKKFGQLEIDFEERQMIEPRPKEVKPGELSSFNQTLKKLTQVPPPHKDKY